MPLPSGALLRHLEWLRGDTTLVEHRSGSTTVRYNANRMTVLPLTYSLFFRPVLPEDSGEYVCIVNEASTRGKRQRPVKLVVEGKALPQAVFFFIFVFFF